MSLTWAFVVASILSKRPKPDVPDFVFDVRVNGQGLPYLHFALMTYSDVHLGTKVARAKSLTHMNQHTNSDHLYILGDAIDGEAMLQKEEWGFGRWHRQVIATVIRKAAQGTNVTYIPGNHDIAIRRQTISQNGQTKLHRNLCGKTLYGIKIIEEALHHMEGGKVKLFHGDQYDGASGHYSPVGTQALAAMGYIDTAFQKVFKTVSLAATSKRILKKIGIMDLLMHSHRRIAADIDADDEISVSISGHTHGSEMRRSREGKLMINDGACTEHVEALVQDMNGTFALIEWHSYGIKVRQENKPARIYIWKDIGLNDLPRQPLLAEDRYTAQADRMIRLIYRTWPPKERQKLRASIKLGNASQQTTYWNSTATIPLANHRHALQFARTDFTKTPPRAKGFEAG